MSVIFFPSVNSWICFVRILFYCNKIVFEREIQKKSRLTSRSSSFADWLESSGSCDIFLSKIHWWSWSSSIVKFSKLLWIIQHASPDVTWTMNHSMSLSSFAIKNKIHQLLFVMSSQKNKNMNVKISDQRNFENRIGCQFLVL